LGKKGYRIVTAGTRTDQQNIRPLSLWSSRKQGCS